MMKQSSNVKARIFILIFKHRESKIEFIRNRRSWRSPRRRWRDQKPDTPTASQAVATVLLPVQVALVVELELEDYL